jgi:exopolyphosphatase/guanosine-5'-triphosphate,3'-diphosphate pyrophosphatase
MPVLAAVDVGSNAIRCVVASIDAERRLELLENIRESVRLGQDVFTGGVISEGTMGRAAEAFRRFAEAIRSHGAIWTKAVATSATREALNKEIFIDRILQASGIELVTIGPEEEARLIHLAVMQKITLKNKLALLVDIGGGSTEITIASGESVLSTESYKMGSVRLLQLLEGPGHDQEEFATLLQEYVDATKRRIVREIGERTIDLCIGTGGNIETLGDLRRQVLGKERDSMLGLAELESLLGSLRSLSFEERIARLGLRPDRADVILPAAIIVRRIMKQAGTDVLQIPRVGLKDGILVDMIQELYGEKRGIDRDQVLSSALALGRKYAFDEQHGLTVSRFAVQLFDQTKPLHNLALEHRMMLEVAALLHDVGTYVNVTGHHKHTQYLLLASPLVGLSREQTAIVANVARYHRKSLPKPQHDSYRVLSSRDRVVVSKLSALLRLADAMDNEHASKVEDFSVELKRPELVLHLKGREDLLLEKWALMQKAPMFEEVYSVRMRIGE